MNGDVRMRRGAAASPAVTVVRRAHGFGYGDLDWVRGTG